MQQVEAVLCVVGRYGMIDIDQPANISVARSQAIAITSAILVRAICIRKRIYDWILFRASVPDCLEVAHRQCARASIPRTVVKLHAALSVSSKNYAKHGRAVP
jgi:hypothetical protein